MERHKTSSQISIDRRSNTTKEGSILSINKQIQIQNDIDNFIQHGLIEPICKYDRKFDFICMPIINRDQAIKQTRRQTYGLIWNSIRSSSISQLVSDGRSCAFVEILHTPAEWSRYDADFLLLKIRQKNFLNGLALRDEFVRILHVILKRDFGDVANNSDKKYPYEFKDIEFTRNMIQLVFNNPQDADLTLVISLILLVEFDVPSSNFFNDAYTALCQHKDLDQCFKQNQDLNRTRVTPFNSIKFIFDYSLTEAIFCDSLLLQKSSPLSSMLTSFLKLRREWSKYIQRASKFASDTIKVQIHADKHRQSACSVNSARSGTSITSAMNKLAQQKVPLSTEIEVAFEFIFSVALLRLLFFTVCTKYTQFGASYENDIAFAIEKALQILSDALENHYLEHPFLKTVNCIPDCLLTHEISVKIGIKKIIKEMQRDWKRNIRR